MALAQIAQTFYPRALVRLVLLLEDWGAGTTDLYTVTATPREVEIHRNDARTADTIRLQLDLRDFPFDPRTVRSVKVELYLGDILAPTGGIDVDVDNFGAFTGFSDSIEAIRSEAGDFVTIEGRDFTGLFLDTAWPGGMIDVTQTLADVISTIIDAVPGAGQIGQSPPICYSPGADSVILADAIGRKKFTPQQKDDCWTVLVDLCGRVGLVPVFVLDVLCILSPADFGVSRTDFVNDGVLTTLSSTLEYGSDLTRLRYTRHAKEAARKQIEVRCWDETTRKASTAKFPTQAIVNKATVGTDGKVTTQNAPILPYFVTGTHTAADLATIAERVYLEASREEMEVEVETMDMVDMDNNDVTKLGNGARVTITIGKALITDIAGLSQSEAIAALTSGPRALARDVATAFVAAFATSQRLAISFYCKEAKHYWSRENGYRCELTCINYVGGTA